MDVRILIIVIAVILPHCQVVLASGHCHFGDPLQGHFCGRGGSRCPDGYYCEISPVDAYAQCCPTHCPHGPALLGTDGNPLFCGLGPFSVTCPDTYRCHVAPNDAWAVCCAA